MTRPGHPTRKRRHWDVDLSSLASAPTLSPPPPLLSERGHRPRTGTGASVAVARSFLGEDRRFWKAQGSGRRRAGLSSNTTHSAQP